MKKLFGTDGVRGTTNVWPMLPCVITELAMASVQNLIDQNFSGHTRFTIVIGKDTRLSGYMVESALVAGFVSMGADVILLGPIPTPGVSVLTRSLRADLGVMISASHNPYADNGIKFFGADGYKLTTKDEENIEHRVYKGQHRNVSAEKIGKAKRLEDATGRYIEFAKATFPRGQRLEGLKIVVDCAQGAAYKIAPHVLWELGAEVIPLGVEPNGLNINHQCGSTAIGSLQEKVREEKADLGIALDGDGDRLLMVDEEGTLIDGDQILALISSLWNAKGMLKGKGVVGTLMSNLGLERHLRKQGLSFYRSSVGDRAVLEMMKQQGCNLGGEQSGHIILSDYGPTGDGTIAALQVLSSLRNSPYSSLKQFVQEASYLPIPQILQNIRTLVPIDLSSAAIVKAISEANHILSSQGGTLLVRTSGTEPLIRIMAQGDDYLSLSKIVQSLSETIHYHVNYAA